MTALANPPCSRCKKHPARAKRGGYCLGCHRLWTQLKRGFESGDAGVALEQAIALLTKALARAYADGAEGKGAR